MCGITGIMAFNEIGRMHMIHLAKATGLLKHRGPDYQGTFITERVALGHRRLSVIDPRPQGHQPMSDGTGRYHIVYNGEIYNYRELRQQMQNNGQEFTSDTDSEVLLYLYIKHGVQCLNMLNGCFAFAILDTAENQLLLARDRFGINPLVYYQDKDKFVFASEMRSLLAYNIPKTLDYQSLQLYLELNYVPAPNTMLTGIKKLLPGCYLMINASQNDEVRYYNIPEPQEVPVTSLSYTSNCKELAELLEAAVVRRLVADVPIGAFLSGGLDSSVLVAIASRHIQKLNTFSIGYLDQPYFDETHYAELVAGKFATNHSVYKLSISDLYQHLFDFWDHLDEPFADSSALPTYILSKYTSKSVTVALSGDGADELFGGYNKYEAIQRSLKPGLANSIIRSLSLITGLLPKSRNGALSNKFRQLDRMARGLELPVDERYWYWASIATKEEALKELSEQALLNLDQLETDERRQYFLKQLGPEPTLNHVLRTDLQLVLPNDMLTKVDWMSMAHGLEVRVPFLDHELVNFVTGLPVEFKINQGKRKRILRDTFKDLLPGEIYQRPKSGFEVPLLGWMRTELSGLIENELLHQSFIKEQGIFDPNYIGGLKKRLHSKNPGDIPARIWGLLVFQRWWKRYMPEGSIA
ncbi:MAG: asparagine synthetase B [Cyclobacteriaceae bacterium]|nr:MAG: asparagine synthetase B [Cyclobacteriaceae bacterium]